MSRSTRGSFPWHTSQALISAAERARPSSSMNRRSFLAGGASAREPISTTSAEDPCFGACETAGLRRDEIDYVAATGLGRISLESSDPQPIRGVCAVFAESEIIHHVSEGRGVADIVCGTNLSLAERAPSRLKPVGVDGPAVFIGGVALREGMVSACRKCFPFDVRLPEHPPHVAAYGAAVLGLQRFQKRPAAAAELAS